MSKASVAQEPSMDEILASIRRIIETGEDRASPTGFRPEAGRDAQLDAIRRGAEDAEASDEPAAERDRYSAVSQNARAHPAPETLASVTPLHSSPADAAFHSHGVDVDHLTVELESELAASWGDFQIHHRMDGGALGSVQETSAYAAQAHVTSISAPPEVRPTAEPVTQTQSREDSTMSETARHTASIDRSSFEPANTDRRELDSHAEYGAYSTSGHDQLISGSSGQMVAASFEELAQAIRNGELKSLEAMAQEMLKPMLAEWLDDNLPRMVERLVREEIERLSRGGRR